LGKEEKGRETRPDEQEPEGKPVGKRGRIVPAGTLGRGKATVMTIGPAQLEAIKRRRAEEKREAEKRASGERNTEPPQEQTN
jgi:hypothetical protein